MKNLLWVQHKSDAYTLTEFLIYILLSTLIYVLFLGVLNREWIEILKIGYKQNMELEIALAGDIIRRDLLCASSVCSNWRESDFIIKKQILGSSDMVSDEWVRWYVSENALLRAVGKYDSFKNVWQSNDVCVVCSNIRQIELNLSVDKLLGFVVGASVKLVLNTTLSAGNVVQQRHFYVALRNRVLQ